MYHQQYPPQNPVQQPYGYPPPQGHSPYPQQPGYGAPPSGPPPQGYYPSHGQAPYPSAPYGAPPPQGYPQQQPPYGQYQPYPPSQQQGYNRPPVPPPAPYGSHPQHQAPGQYPHPSQYSGFPAQVLPSMPSLGYVPGQMAPGDFRQEADALRKAMKGFGTNEATLIQVLARLDPLQMAAVRSTYTSHIGRDLYKDVKSETDGYFEMGLLAIIEGPLMHDAILIREAVKGAGTKEWLLNDVLLGRSNADLNAIKDAYHQKYGRSLQKDVEDDLSRGTEKLFTSVIVANRHDDSMSFDAINEARVIHGATAGHKDATEVWTIFTKASNRELYEINNAFQARYNVPLEKHIEKEFSGHMKGALLYMLRTAVNPAMRDALLLEECMKGAGTKDEKLVVRIVRLHWNREHKEQVKRKYYELFKIQLQDRVRGETRGDYQKLMLALLE